MTTTEDAPFARQDAHDQVPARLFDLESFERFVVVHRRTGVCHLANRCPYPYT